jgi:hypothetical protein
VTWGVATKAELDELRGALPVSRATSKPKTRLVYRSERMAIRVK